MKRKNELAEVAFDCASDAHDRLDLVLRDIETLFAMFATGPSVSELFAPHRKISLAEARKLSPAKRRKNLSKAAKQHKIRKQKQR